MKKAIIAVVALLAAAGISIGAFLAVKSKSETETKNNETSLADNVLFDIDSASINKVEITNSDGSYTIELEDEKWVLTENTGTFFDVNQVTVQGLCTFISSLTADTNYGELTEENKTTYGLDDPYTVTVSDGKDSHTLYIGSKSPTGEYYYGYTAEKEKVYAIRSVDANSILTTRLSLKDNNFIPYKDTEIIGLELIRDGMQVYELNYDTENHIWKLPDKYEMLTVDQTKVSNVVTLITRLSAEEMLPENDDDITTYGFDKPTAEFVVKSSDGTSKTLLFSRYGQNADTYTHVYNQEAKQAEVYFASDLDFIDKRPIDFVMKTVECADMYTVSEFEIISEAVNEKFTVNANEGWAECRGTRIDLTNAELNGYFENFFDLFAYISIVDIGVDMQPELKDPMFTAKYVNSDGSSSQVDFVSAGSGGLCFVFVDGEYTGTLTSNQFIYGNDSVSAAFELLCRQANIK